MAVLLVSAITVAFTNASGARLIAVNSDLLQWSNVTSGASAVARASINQALVFTVDEQLDVSPAESTRAALDEAERAIAGLRDVASDPPEGLGTLAASALLAADRGTAAVDALRDGDTPRAVSIIESSFEPAYTRLAVSLAAAQQLYAAEIDAAESTASRIESAMQWTAFLLVPGIAILLYRVILRRRFERRKLEFEARLTAERELNVAKDEIIAGISHELRTPLTSIVGFSQHLIEQGLGDHEEALELITVISNDAQDLTRMVEDLLTAARLDSEALTYDMSEVDVVAETMSILSQLRRDEIELRVTGDPERVWADSGRTRQIIRNLVANALQHGGDEVYVVVEGAGDATICEVVDDGPGVPPGIVDRLFEPFVHEGTESLLTGSVGLGLAIARSLADAMGGGVTHRRRDGLTVFRLELPVARRSPGPSPARSDAPVEEPAGGALVSGGPTDGDSLGREAAAHAPS